MSDSFGALLRAHRLAADLTIEGLSVHPLPFSVALTQHRLGTALRCAGRIVEARQALAEAARLYEEEGDGDKAAEVLKELEAAE